MHKQSNLPYTKAMRTSKNRFTCKVSLYQRTKISVVLSQLEEPGIKFFLGSTPDLLQGFSSLRSSPGFPMGPSSKKVFVGPWLIFTLNILVNPRLFLKKVEIRSSKCLFLVSRFIFCRISARATAIFRRFALLRKQ